MAWDTNGSNQYAQFAMSAALKSATGGPFTFGAVVNLDAATDGALIHMLDGTSGRHFMEIFGTYNWGTAAAAKSGPAGSTGSWVHIIMTKATGTVTPEYTIIPLSTGTPSSGTCTGGNLANGAAPGASGVIQILRFGTSATEYVDAKVAGLWCHASYMNQAAREALLTWALTVTAASASSLGWAVRLDTLSTINDATPAGGNETGRFGTSPFTLVADPTGDPNNFFGSTSAVSVADTPGGVRLRSGYETVSSGVAVADSPAGERWRSPEGLGVLTGVQAALDAPNGLRLRSGYETVTFGVSIPDAPNGLRARSGYDSAGTGVAAADAPRGLGWRSGYESVSIGVSATDAPGRISWRSGADTTTQPITVTDVATGMRLRSGYESISLGGSPVTVADGVPDGFRLRSVGGAAILGVLTTDLPNGWRVRATPDAVTSGLTVSDLPNGLRLRSGTDAVSISASNPTDQPNGWRWNSGASGVSGAVVVVPDVTIVAEVSTVRVVASVNVVRVDAPVRRFRA